MTHVPIRDVACGLDGYRLAIEDAQRLARPNSAIVKGLMRTYAQAILELEKNQGRNYYE